MLVFVCGYLAVRIEWFRLFFIYMKKVLFFYTVFLFAASLGLLACGGDESDDVAKKETSTSQNEKLVRRIEIYKQGREMNQRQVIQFVYGDNNRIIAADYWGVEHVCGPVGARVHFIVSSNVLSLMFSSPTMDSGLYQGFNGEGFGQGVLNSIGLLEEDYIDATEYEIKGRKYSILTYEHNEKGQITKLVIHHTTGSYTTEINYT